MNRRFLLGGAACAALLASAAFVASALAQERPKGEPRFPEGMPDLVGGLKASPGCLGVETARTESGKRVIFAWFKDKKATLDWYSSDVHRGAMKAFFPGPPAREPLAKVPDDSGPILAIASLTLSEEPRFEESSLPVSQISIELYQPITGGIFLGGRFAPDALVVPDLLDLTKRKG